MNKLLLILLSCMVFFASNAFSQLGQENLLQLFVKNQMDSALDKKEKFQLAKFMLVNGDTLKAKYYLQNLYDLGREGEQIRSRYLAMIAFVEDDFTTLLNRPRVEYQYYPHVCLLDVIAALAHEDIVKTKQEFVECKVRVDLYNNDNFFWLSTLIKMKENLSRTAARRDEETDEILNYILKPKDFLELLSFADSTDTALMWIKIGLYSGLQEEVIKLLPNLPEEVFESPRFREVVALINYRNNDFSGAKNFAEDIDTANAHNILAGIYLEQQKYELAFAEYKLALLKKHNSRNALEKIIPLAYLLSDYDQGLDALKQIQHTGVDEKTISIIKAAFLLKKKDYEAAWKTLAPFDLTQTAYIPDKVFQLKYFLSILLNRPDELESYSNYACNQFDGVACWVQTQLLIWPEFSKHFKKEIIPSQRPSFTTDLLTQSWEKRAIKEDIVIDQENLDQLDEEQTGF